MQRVWWIQNKPFSPERRYSDEAQKFQEECLKEGFFGIGWRNGGIDLNPGQEYSEEIAEQLRWKIRNRNFTHAQNLMGMMKEDDVILTRLNGCYYWGLVKGKVRYSEHNQLTWYTTVKEGWDRLGEGKDLPNHVRGKLSGKYYQGTVAEIDGLAANSILLLTGQKNSKKERLTVDNFHEALGDDDLEDLLAEYMLKTNPEYVFLPSSCKKNTPGIEYAMYDPQTAELIACQTKIKRRIDAGYYLTEETFAKYKKIYLFSGLGYDNLDDDMKNLIIVDRKELYDVFKNNAYYHLVLSQYFEFDGNK